MPALLEAKAAAAELKGWSRTYLLLETECLEDMLRQQPDAPDHPSAFQAIRKIAPCLPMRWQWEDTDYHVHKTVGPLLIDVPKGSPLIQAYLDEWCAHDVGVWLRSSAGLDEVHAHLRSLTWVELPAELPSRFRLQETSALQSVLRALPSERANLLLGPIEQVLWRENAGPAFRWWRFDNASPTSGCTEITPWFSFTAWEAGDIDAGLSAYMLRWQTALTMAQDGSDHDTAQARVHRWLADGNVWGYARQKDLAALMEIFRHPEFPSQQRPLTRILTEDGPAPSARLRRCMDMLETPEEATHEQS